MHPWTHNSHECHPFFELLRRERKSQIGLPALPRTSRIIYSRTKEGIICKLAVYLFFYDISEVFLGGNATWQSVSSFGDRGGKKTPRWGEDCGGQCRGQWLAFPAQQCCLHLIKVLKFSFREHRTLSTHEIVTELEFTPTETDHNISALQLWLGQGWPCRKSKPVRACCQTSIEHFGKESSVGT